VPSDRDATGARIDDIGRRASDIIHLHVLAGRVGEWVALRLADGSSDGQTYPTRRDAITHQLHEQLCCYIRVTPDGITPQHAYRFIQLNRFLYDAGFRLADPDMPGEPIYPETPEELAATLKGLRSGR
jgi:hypothetical protein